MLSSPLQRKNKNQCKSECKSPCKSKGLVSKRVLHKGRVSKSKRVQHKGRVSKRVLHKDALQACHLRINRY